MAILSSYLNSVIDLKLRRKNINKFTKLLRDSAIRDTFDTIAFKGVSGALIAPTIANNLKKEIIVVRSKTAGHHSSFNIEGNYKVKNYIIIDDICSTGQTLRDIMGRIEKWELVNREVNCVGIFLYSSYADCTIPEDIWERVKGPMYYGGDFIGNPFTDNIHNGNDKSDNGEKVMGNSENNNV